MLVQYCRNMTKNNTKQLNQDKSMGLRILCPEYSFDAIDVKTFPVSEQEDIFILCWNMEEDGRLYATINPYEKPFVYSTAFHSGERTQYHTHDYIELAYVVEGEFQQRIMGNDVLFKNGELCLIDKNCPHQDFLLNHNSIILFIGLANEMFHKVMVEKIGEEKILNFLHTALMKQKDIRQYLHFKPKNPEDLSLEELLHNLLRELECNDEASKHICRGLIMRILHYISTMYDFRLSNEQRKKMNWLIFEEITKYIEANYAEITIKELTAKFHFNEDYYNRILKAKAGMTYSEYVQDIRLKNAYRLLRDTRLTVDVVAEMVGYHNKGYFYKIFVQKYGTTPAMLRKKLL